MSMLSLQADGLREMAVKLGVNGVCTDDLSELCVMLREAADTIESMRDRLQAATLGNPTCEYVIEDNMNESEGMGDVWFRCTNCDMKYDYYADDWLMKQNHCPHCGARIRKKVDE